MPPVAELHVHIEGTLEPELLVTLAARNGTAMPTLDLDELRAQYRFDSLRSFLDLYYANLAVLKTEQDFYDLASAYLTRAAAAGVRRAEIFFDPQTHLANGVPLDVLFGGLAAALADGARDHGISADLIPCFLRELSPDAADAVLRACLPFRDSFIGVGLDSVEVGHPPALFTEVYRRAAAEGLRLVAHAGEEGGPEYVREALDELHVERRVARRVRLRRRGAGRAGAELIRCLLRAGRGQADVEGRGRQLAGRPRRGPELELPARAPRVRVR